MGGAASAEPWVSVRNDFGSLKASYNNTRLCAIMCVAFSDRDYVTVGHWVPFASLIAPQPLMFVAVGDPNKTGFLD